MKKLTIKTLGLTCGLSVIAGATLADTQNGNPFLPTYTSAETITVAFKGKPPYRNRAQHLAQLRAQQEARAETENLERTELSALEVGKVSDESVTSQKTYRKKYGHPYHR